MPATDLLCLNRVIKPQVPLEEFLKFAADLGARYVEVRNDFTDKGILDGLPDTVLQKAFKDTGIKVLTINALYPFDDSRVLKENIEKLKGLIAEAQRINCPQIVLCPLNDANDKRNPAQRADELAAALDAYGPVMPQPSLPTPVSKPRRRVKLWRSNSVHDRPCTRRAARKIENCV